MRKLYRLALAVLLLQIILICFGPPRALEDWLNLADADLPAQPRYVVVLGASGVPSGATLARCYAAAEFGKHLTNANFIVALPTAADPATSSVGKMRDELVLRGLPAERITMEHRGLNTAQQADGIARLLGPTALAEPVVVISSHYHVRRAVVCFRKAGFTNVTGLTAESPPADADPGPWAWLRYGLWNNATGWVNLLRELLALAAAKLS